MRVGYRDIVVPIPHHGTVAPRTNTYDVQYNVWFASDDAGQAGISAGMFIPEGQGPEEGAFPKSLDAEGFPPLLAFALPGIYWQSFYLRPGARKRAVSGLSPYRTQRGSVVFHDVPLNRDRYYAIGVMLFASIKGRPGRGERPPEGGAVSFLADDFIIHPVRIRQPNPAHGRIP